MSAPVQPDAGDQRPLIGTKAWDAALPIDPQSLACRLNDVWCEATKLEPEEQRFLVQHSESAIRANRISLPDPDPEDSHPNYRRLLRQQVDAYEELKPAVLAAEEFAQWLVAMDDVDNPAGLEARRTVTLTQIIGRARELLGVLDV